jgi:AraC family transcriptional regulator
VNYLHQVQRAIDYIEARLDQDIATADVARYVRTSHWHFLRMFKALTSETLKSYIRARRLANALDALLDPNARILEIALAAGFESQASFTRAFVKAFEITPARYRAQRNRTKFVRKVRIDERYVRHLHHNVSRRPTILRMPAMQVVGLATSFYGVDSDKSNMGDKLPPLWDAFLARMAEIDFAIPTCCYGVVQPDPTSEQLNYIACVAVSKTTRLPKGMVAMRLPKAVYAQFTHQGLPQDLNTTVNYIYGNWLVRSGARHTHGSDVEFYGSDYIPNSKRSIIRYAVPIRGLKLAHR